jgi:hypothetical protein
VVLWQGLGAVFPGGEEPLALLLRYLRYALVGAWVGGLAPLLFVRLGLAAPAPPDEAWVTAPTGGDPAAPERPTHDRRGTRSRPRATRRALPDPGGGDRGAAPMP